MLRRPFLGSDFVFMEVNEFIWIPMLEFSAGEFKAIVCKSGLHFFLRFSLDDARLGMVC